MVSDLLRIRPLVQVPNELSGLYDHVRMCLRGQTLDPYQCVFAGKTVGMGSSERLQVELTDFCELSAGDRFESVIREPRS